MRSAPSWNSSEVLVAGTGGSDKAVMETSNDAAVGEPCRPLFSSEGLATRGWRTRRLLGSPGADPSACAGKLSAVLKGYYEDPFIQYMVSKPTPRPPMINRGHYARVAAIRPAL